MPACPTTKASGSLRKWLHWPFRAKPLAVVIDGGWQGYAEAHDAEVAGHISRINANCEALTELRRENADLKAELQLLEAKVGELFSFMAECAETAGITPRRERRLQLVRTEHHPRGA